MKKLTMSTWVVALFVLPSFFVPAFAQQASSSATNGSAGAPIFSIQNFQGDARSADLYYYMHQQTNPQWDVYRRRLQDAAGKIVNTQPLRQSPSPENLAGNTPAMNTINSAAAGTQAQPQQATVATAQPEPQPEVSTNVQGTVLTPGISVPGLVDP